MLPVLLAGAGAALALWGPGGESSGPVFCLFRRTTGLACPSCGLTRAAGALARGDLAASFAFHPLLGVVLLYGGTLWLLWGSDLWRGTKLVERFAVPLTWVLLALLLLTWGARWFRGTLPA